jgi:hypothetical protein
MPSEIVCLSVEQVIDAIAVNKRGEKVKKLESIENSNIAPIIDYQYQNAVDEKLLTRIEDRPSKPQKHHHKHRR